jgi:predicted 2-oxoglutarate/Fe(II)-dependent dioxygenase YbiX
MLSPSACARIVDAVRASTAWRDAPLYAAAGAEPVVNTAVRSASLLRERDLPDEAARACGEIRERAVAHGDARARGLEAGEIQLVRYRPGGFFYTHQDGLDAPSEWRKRSFVLYLNDELTGGETTFPALGVAVLPRAGYALTFPPHAAHRAEPVVAGEKYVFTFWLGRAAIAPPVRARRPR